MFAVPKQPAPVREDWGPGPHEVHSLPPAQPAPVQDASKQFHEWAVAEHAAQRQWVGLTAEETSWCTAHRHLIEWANDKLKERNNG